MAARDVTVGPLVQHLPAAAMAHSQPQPPYYAIRTRRPAERSSTSSVDSTCSSGIAEAPPATHDISRVSYHVKQLDSFAQTLEAVRTSSSFDSRHMSRFPPPPAYLRRTVRQQGLPQQGPFLPAVQKRPGPPPTLEDGRLVRLARARRPRGQLPRGLRLRDGRLCHTLRQPPLGRHDANRRPHQGA